MNLSSINYFGSFFVLLLGIFLITSCLEMSSSEDSLPAALQGKWRLVRIEEGTKTVSPPAEHVSVWIEFAKAGTHANDQSGFPHSLNGEAMVNLYFGGFRATGEELSISNVGATERGGPANYMQFDSYYFSELQKAVRYTLQESGQTLLIGTSDNHLLLYTRAGNEE